MRHSEGLSQHLPHYFSYSISHYPYYHMTQKSEEHKKNPLSLYHQLAFHPSHSSKYLFIIHEFFIQEPNIFHLMSNHLVKYKIITIASEIFDD